MGLEELLALKNRNKTSETLQAIREEGLPSEVEVTIKKSNIIIDNSMFSTYQACPRLFDYRYNRQLVGLNGKGNSLEVGSIMHKILEVYYGNIIKGFKRELAISNGLTAGQEYYFGCKQCKLASVGGTDIIANCDIPEHKKEPIIGCDNTPLDSDKKNIGYNWVIKTAEQYFEHYKNDFWIPIDTETVVGKVLYEDDNIRILWKAKLDMRVDTNNGIFPCDHKTMKQNRQMLSLNNQFMGQALVCGTRNVIINKIGWQTTLEPKEKFIRGIQSYSFARLIEWQSLTLPNKIYEFLGSMESGYWGPNFTHCESKYGNCFFHEVCEAEPNMREETLKMYFKVGQKWDPTNE